MKLLLDIGNTQTVVGVYNDNIKIESWRFSSKLFSTEDEIASLIRSFFKFKEIDFKDIDQIIISSVVPEFSYIVERKLNLTHANLPHMFHLSYFNFSVIIMDSLR